MADHPGLWLGEEMYLPPDVVTETLLIIAKRGSGKTHCASVLVEEMVSAGLPVAVIDPIGVWWGLRSDASGDGPGLPVTILGGEHGDLPLSGESGALVADLIIDERLPVVIDLSMMSKTQQRRFVTDFLERLYHRSRDPLHLVIDEADLFAPLRGARESARLLGAYEDIVRRGRARGLGCTSITQRPAVLHTDIRSQAEVLIALRLIGTHDVAAIDDWIRLHATDEEAREVKASLPSLPVGTAWIWSPGWLEILTRVRIRQRLTFDSSATPKVGQRRIVPRAFAAVDPSDLERLAGRLASPADKAAEVKAALATSTGRLEAEIGKLRAQLAAEQARPPERVEVLAVSLEQYLALADLAETMSKTIDGLKEALGRVQPGTPSVVPLRHTPAENSASPESRRHAPKPVAPPVPRAQGEAKGEPTLRLNARQRAILTVLAQYPDGRTKAQLAILSGNSAKSSTFDNTLSALRVAALIGKGSPIRVTDEGTAALGGDWEPLPSGPALVEHWLSKLSRAERAVLRALLDAWPTPLAKGAIADASGYSGASSTLDNALSRLRGLHLITGYGEMLADETLAREVTGG